MKIGDAFHATTSLGIETSPFIYYVESTPHHVERMRAIFTLTESRSVTVVTSTLTLTEVLVKPRRLKDDNLIAMYRRILLNTLFINTLPVTIAIADRAGDLRARYNLKTPDAIQVATAIEAGCDALLTNDIGLKRVQDIRILILDELEIDPT